MTVVWITGLPSSGKSTLAARVQRHLAGAVVLDGDEVREAIEMHGYDRAARDSFYRVLARLAALVARQGVIAIVAATSPSPVHRAFAREVAPRFIEVFVDTPLAECTDRDTKGLYAAARSGDVANLPGDGAAYEHPTSPNVIAHGGEDEGAVAMILELVHDRLGPPCGA
jgi:adenylylsulfate kinase